MRRLLLPVAIVVALATTACDPGELAEFVSGALDTDWSLSDDETLQAAGDSATVVDAEKDARSSLQDALESKDPSDAEQAEQKRPDDPKYPMYTAALAYAAGDRDGQVDAVQRAVGLVSQQQPDSDLATRQRAGEELYLDAVYDILEEGEDFPGRQRLVDEYCDAIGGGYADRYSASAPGDVAFYLSLHTTSAVSQRDC